MNKKEINITIPEGYEIDKEKSSFKKIVFKKITPTKWRDDGNANVDGYFIGNFGDILKCSGNNKPVDYNIFATKKQAKRAKAEARISQIIANDKRFGGRITDEEWSNTFEIKYTIIRRNDNIDTANLVHSYQFLAFHTPEQRDLFLQENKEWVEKYFML